MITERETIKCEAVFNDDHTHKFLLKRVWNKNKPLATVIMLNPCDADALLTDTTTYLVINNVARLEEFGGVNIVNLYSIITTKLIFRWNPDDELNLQENDYYIKKAVEESSKVIIAWGRGVDSNKRLSERAMQVLNNLLECKANLFVISDGDRSGLHPLTPSIRNLWVLETLEEASEKQKQKEVAKKHKEVVTEAEKSVDVTTTEANLPEYDAYIIEGCETQE